MPEIRPVSDQDNNIADTHHTVHEMNVARELCAAEVEAETTPDRFEHADVMSGILTQLKAIRNV